MAPVWFALRAGMRRRWRTLVSLALLLGLAGGVVLTAAAGARRTDTAYPRLLTWANASQVTALLGGLDPAYFAALDQLPQVAAVATAMQYNIALPVSGGLPDNQVEVLASSDGSLGTTVDRVKVLQGQMFGSGAAGEAVIDPGTAARLHLAPGDMLHLTAVPYYDASQDLNPAKLQVPLTFRVAAVAVFDDQVVPTTSNSSEPRILLSPGFTRTVLATRGYGTKGSIDYLAQAEVRLKQGADPAAFIAAAQALSSRYPGVRANGGLVFTDSSPQVAGTERAIRPLAVALALFGTLAGLIALAVIGQLLARRMTLDAAGYGVLSALGMTRGTLLALAAVRLALVTVAGGVIAVGIAIAASPLMPIGAARLAEPQPGIGLDAAVLGIGFATVVLLPLVVLAAPAVRAVRQARGSAATATPPATRPTARASWLAGALTRAGTVTGGVGTRMAFEPGHGRTAVPVRSALAGTAIAVAAVVAAAVFGTSLVGLVSSPEQYGQNWGQQLSLGFAAIPASYAAQFAATPDVTGYALGDIGQLDIAGTRVAAVGVNQVHGDGYLTMLAGRPPTNAGEIALGAQTMRALGVRIGQTVRATVDWATGHPGPATQRLLRVTGTVVLPDFGQSGLSSDTDLGNGAVVSPTLLSTIQTFPGCTSARDTCYSLLLFRYRPGTNMPAAQTALLAAAAKAGCPYGACTVTADQRPGDIKNYAAIRDTPLALAAVLGVLAVGTLAHVLLTGVRRRRRDLAVLKTLGFTRWEVLRTVAWEASALAAAALVVGVPLGVIAGRVGWALFANATGIASQATVNVPLVLLAIPATLLLANVIAAWPGWAAARLRPAQVLRSE
ncbi:MAG TPA: FtsX-like permease family protein [Streptosporangiaceae bacterium]|nr:FtsX-like permease family protein [Streptosporangiaceae bacterium]